MENKDYKPKIRLNPFVVAGVIIGIIAIILLIISIMNMFRTNPYGDETVIDNLSEKYSDLPQEQKDLIYFKLYNMLQANLPEDSDVPKSGAFVREGTDEHRFYDTEKINYGKFIVDVPEVERSFQVQFEWSPVKDNKNLGGYPVLITCLHSELRIYENDTCENSEIEQTMNWVNAFQLDYTVGARTSYVIRSTIQEYLLDEIEEYEYKVVINESTIRRDKSQSDLVYYFSFSLNGKYTFNVAVKMDDMFGDSYIAIYVSGNDMAKGFIMTDSSELSVSLAAWLGEISQRSDLVIDIKNLSGEEEN